MFQGFHVDGLLLGLVRITQELKRAMDDQPGKLFAEGVPEFARLPLRVRQGDRDLTQLNRQSGRMGRLATSSDLLVEEREGQHISWPVNPTVFRIKSPHLGIVCDVYADLRARRNLRREPRGCRAQRGTQAGYPAGSAGLGATRGVPGLPGRCSLSALGCRRTVRPFSWAIGSCRVQRFAYCALQQVFIYPAAKLPDDVDQNLNSVDLGLGPLGGIAGVRARRAHLLFFRRRCVPGDVG